MDRRNFLKGMLAAGVGAAIIPYADLMKLGYKKTESGFYVKVADKVFGYTDMNHYLCGDLVKVASINKNMDLIGYITTMSHSMEKEGILKIEMEVRECQSQRDQISLQMRTLNISMDSESQAKLTCLGLENTLKESLVSVKKMPKKY